MARNANKPPSFIAPDLTLIQMAKLPPQNEQQLRSLRGMPNISRQIAEKLLAAVKTASQLKEDDLPEVQRGPRADPQTEVVSGLLNVVTQLRAEELEISRSYLASRDQLNSLAAWWLKARKFRAASNSALGKLAARIVGRRIVGFAERSFGD